MDHPFNFSAVTGERTVYVRSISVEDLPQDVQEQLGDSTIVYSLNRPDGERIALVKDREMAFSIALHNDLAPVSVH